MPTREDITGGKLFFSKKCISSHCYIIGQCSGNIIEPVAKIELNHNVIVFSSFRDQSKVLHERTCFDLSASHRFSLLYGIIEHQNLYLLFLIVDFVCLVAFN